MGKGTEGQGQTLQPTDHEWMVPKQPKAVMLVEPKKRKKSMKMGDIASVEEEDNPDDILEGFHLQEESPHCINMKRAEDYQAYLRQIVLDFE